jgi:hypothetical protein
MARPVVRRHPNAALRRFVADLSIGHRDAVGGWLAFSDDAAALGLGPDWRESVAAVEAEGSALIGALPCPDAIPHGWERTSTEPLGQVEDFSGGPCPSCGAIV